MATLQDLQELFANRSAVSVAIEINGFTGFRTTLIEELTPEEINRLYRIHAPKTIDIEEEYNAFKEELLLKAWRSKILAVAEQTGIKKAGSFQEFNNWMLVSSIFKKTLNTHSLEELKELNMQFHALKYNNAKSAKKPYTKSWQKKSENLRPWN